MLGDRGRTTVHSLSKHRRGQAVDAAEQGGFRHQYRRARRLGLARTLQRVGDGGHQGSPRFTHRRRFCCRRLLDWVILEGCLATLCTCWHGHDRGAGGFEQLLRACPRRLAALVVPVIFPAVRRDGRVSRRGGESHREEEGEAEQHRARRLFGGKSEPGVFVSFVVFNLVEVMSTTPCMPTPTPQRRRRRAAAAHPSGVRYGERISAQQRTPPAPSPQHPADVGG